MTHSPAWARETFNTRTIGDVGGGKNALKMNENSSCWLASAVASDAEFDVIEAEKKSHWSDFSFFAFPLSDKNPIKIQIKIVESNKIESETWFQISLCLTHSSVCLCPKILYNNPGNLFIGFLFFLPQSEKKSQS